MARIAGVNVPLNKRVEIGLTYIYGIGRSTSNDLLSQAGVHPDTYVRDLTGPGHPPVGKSSMRPVVNRDRSRM